jgi:hypothetical protein
MVKVVAIRIWVNPKMRKNSKIVMTLNLGKRVKQLRP